MQNGSKALPEPMQTAQRGVGSAGSETLRWKPQLHLMGFTHLPNPTDPSRSSPGVFVPCSSPCSSPTPSKLTTHCPLMSFWHMSSPRPPRIPNKQRKRSINPSSRTSSQPSSEPFILQIVPQHTDPRFLFLFLHLSDHHQGE